MAIPTLSLNSAAAFRPTYQDYVSKTRQMEHENRAKWADTAKYFHNNQVMCIKNNQWGSEQSFHQSLETFASERMQEMQKVENAKSYKSIFGCTFFLVDFFY